MTDTALTPPEEGMVCDQVGGAVVWYWPVVQGEVIAVPRHITVGAFFDRFGPMKWAILADTDPQVRAVILDASVRS